MPSHGSWRRPSAPERASRLDGRCRPCVDVKFDRLCGRREGPHRAGRGRSRARSRSGSVPACETTTVWRPVARIVGPGRGHPLMERGCGLAARPVDVGLPGRQSRREIREPRPDLVERQALGSRRRRPPASAGPPRGRPAPPGRPASAAVSCARRLGLVTIRMPAGKPRREPASDLLGRSTALASDSGGSLRPL